MRTFIALELPEKFAFEVEGLVRALGRDIDGRTSPAENLHLTLAFLGEVDDAGTGRAMDAIDAACAGVGPVPLACEGLGSFGRPSDSTLYLAIRKDPALMDLVGHLRAALGERGLAYDEKTFLPHITLARRAKLPSGALPDLPFPHDGLAERVTLFRSILDGTGATYKPLYTVGLG